MSADPLRQESPTPSPTWLTTEMVDAGMRALNAAAAQGNAPATALSCAFKAMLKVGETASEGPWPVLSGNDLLAWHSLWLRQPSMLPPFVVSAMFERLKQLLEEVGMLRQSHDEQLVLRVTAYRQIEALLAKVERAGELLTSACTGDLDPQAVDTWVSESEITSMDLVLGRAATEAQSERLRLQETLAGQELWNAGALVAVQQLLFAAINHLGKAAQIGDQPDSAAVETASKPSRSELIQGLAYALYAIDMLDANSPPAPLDHLALETYLCSLKREHTDTVTLPRHRLEALVQSGKQREAEIYERVRQMATFHKAPEGFHEWIDLMQSLTREGAPPAGE
ncbi:hypothetical protein ACSVIJ_12655 [Pseudomonas sp. NCHU5208]|uniref:hypothetical protein n=1 Tax=unclassified Pseudomonas TaxID=196821 RepID=UPI003F9E2193